MKKRLFVAIKEDSFRREFEGLIKRLKKEFRTPLYPPLVRGELKRGSPEVRGKRRRSANAGGESVNWVRPENLHLTLAFLGNVQEKRMGVLNRILKDFVKNSRGSSPRFLSGLRMTNDGFEISFDRIDFIKSRGLPRVIYVGVKANHILSKMILDLDKILIKERFKPKSHAKNIHLTLGRIKHSLNSKRSIRRSAPQDDILRGVFRFNYIVPKKSFKIKKIKVVESVPCKNGVKYEIIASYYFKQGNHCH